MSKIISTIVLAIILLSPVATLAATPTAAQIIRAEFKNQSTTNTAERVNMVVDVNYSRTYADKKKPAESVLLKVRNTTENFPINDTLSNLAVNYSVPQILVKAEGETLVDSKDAFSLDVRVFIEEKVVYVRLNQLDPKAVELLSSLGIKTESVMGQWVRISLNDLLETEIGKELGGGELDALIQTNTLSNEKMVRKLRAWYVVNELKLGSPLTIVSSGKITKNTVGQKVQTVRVTLNPKWYPAIEKLMIELYKEDNSEATPAELKRLQVDIKDGIALVKKALAKTTLEVNVNLTTAKVTGFNVKYKQVETKYRYVGSENAKGKYTEKKVANGKETVGVQVSLNFEPGSGLALQTPEQSLDVMKVWDMVYTKPEPILIDEECDITEHVGDDAGVKADDYCANMIPGLL